MTILNCSLTFDNFFETAVPMDENHPEYQKNVLYLYDDSNVLVEGVNQAKVLIKTLVFDELPEKIEDAFDKLKLPVDIERSMQQSVLVSHLLDAEQKKTAKIKIPERPAFILPRNYGITDPRKK